MGLNFVGGEDSSPASVDLRVHKGERGPAVAFHGFVPGNERVHRLVNFTLAAVMLVMVLPVFVVLSAALFATQGWRIFYCGSRLGKDRRPFDLYKFRTLDHEKALKLTADKVLPEGSNIETPLGRYLRDSRLDELPQLFNVLKGDMNLIGPRPVRPEIAQQYSETINGYDVRFAVKPGLLGQSQAWFSHGSSKQIRARLNYMHCRAPVSYLHDFMMIANVTANVGRSSVSGIVSGLLPIQPEKIARARANHFRATAILDGVPGTMPVMALGRDNIELLAGTAQVRTGSDLTLTCCLPRGRKVRIALTCVKVLPGSQNTCFQYAPRTDFARHMLDRYAFGLVVVPPKGAFRNGATARVRVLRDRIRAAFTPRNTNARDLGVTGQNSGAPSLPSRAATGLVLSEELGLSGAGRSHNLRQRPGARLSSVSKPALRSSGSR